jgi:hypothetical protein
VEVARKTTTVWRAVATGGGGGGEENHHRLANGGYGRRWRWRGKPPPSGERWLREEVDVTRKTSTVWRAVATGGGGYGRRWLRVEVATGGGGGCEEGYHRLASGGYGWRWLREGGDHDILPNPTN